MRSSREQQLLNALNHYVREEREYGCVADMSWDDVMWCRYELISDYGWTPERLKEGWPSLFG